MTRSDALRLVAILCGSTWLAVPYLRSVGSQLEVPVNLLGFGLHLTCWVLSIIVWTKSRRSGFLHVLALVLLAAFGFIFGWIYLLFRAEETESPAVPAGGRI